MSEIHEFITVDVPFENVPALAKRFLASLAQTDQGEAIVNLQAVIGKTVVKRDALITIVPARVYPGLEIMEIAWHAREDGLYPTFKGTLSAEQEGLNYCRLDLDGGYAPPLGVAGLVFDGVLGHRIAVQVVGEFLLTLKAAFERLNDSVAGPQPAEAAQTLRA